MKSPFALAAITTLALTLHVVPVQSRQGPGFDAFAPFPYESAARDGYRVPYEGGAAGYGHDLPYPGGGDEWTSDPYRASPPGGYHESQTWGGEPGYPAPPDRPVDFPRGLYPERRGPDLPATGYRMPPAGYQELPPPRQPEYRFRGDEQPRFGGVPWRDGYRFRPLTEPERDRIGYPGGWRPPVPAHPGERGGEQGDFSPDEAFGYQPDDWFRRSFPDRP